jgi:hypothetical protein
VACTDLKFAIRSCVLSMRHQAMGDACARTARGSNPSPDDFVHAAVPYRLAGDPIVTGVFAHRAEEAS